MSWWDGDMRDKDQRTLLGWSLASGQFRRKPYRKNFADSGPKPERQSFATRAWKDRRLAEMVEGVPSRSDQSGYGLGPFGRFTLGGWRKR